MQGDVREFIIKAIILQTIALLSLTTCFYDVYCLLLLLDISIDQWLLRDMLYFYEPHYNTHVAI